MKNKSTFHQVADSATLYCHYQKTEELYKKFYDKSLRFATRLCGRTNQAEVEDLVSAVWLKFLSKTEITSTPLHNPEAYLLRMIRNKLIDDRRTNPNRVFLNSISLEKIPNELHPFHRQKEKDVSQVMEEIQAQKISRVYIRKICQSISQKDPHKGQLVSDYFLNQLTFQELCEKYPGYRRGQISLILHRAQERVKNDRHKYSIQMYELQ